ncbi:hypothetical protein IV203_003554 [Nitzschia inconspicua]|uniref:Uncharacterized protein n=1 Tax=Nitzschia inconspicua TaxID=303405 RepID=A0A9K3L3I2_9STRA|nr:hypothetical protein IV203_003554 [Nitzschia inconspicua]
MAPNMDHGDFVLPPLLREDDHDERNIICSAPSSPISVYNASSTADDTSTEGLFAPRLKEKSKRRSADSPTSGRRRNPSIGENPPSTTKSVRFHSRVRFKNVKHIDDYTDREYFSTWYTEEDLQEIFNHCVDTVRKMVNGFVLNEDNGYSPRGLEYKTPTGAKTRKENKARGIRIVLDEQERQRTEGVIDPERLAKLYSDGAADSRRAYRLMAIKDQEEARPILQSKSSLLIMQQKLQLRTKKETESCEVLDQEQLHNSATSVLDEFQRSYGNNATESDEPTSPRVRKFQVTFGAVVETADDFAN